MANGNARRGRTPQEGVPALFKYQQVLYSHLPIEPGATWLLTADPWAFLYAKLSAQVPKIRGVNRTRCERAIYYAELASGFYESAASARLPAKATLAYYGMLNLVKCHLSMEGVELESTWEHHGLTLPPGTAREVHVLNQKDGVSIFAEFARTLGTPITKVLKILLPELCVHVPELHELAFATGIIPGSKRKFLPVRIDLKVTDTKNKLFSEIAYDKRQEARVDTTKFYKGARRAYFSPLANGTDQIRFRSKGRKKLSQGNWPRIFRNVQEEFSAFDLASILTRDSGYRYYCDLAPGPVHHLCCTLALFYYVGTIARYRPTEMQSLLQSEFRPIISEALATSPTQFLYQVVSRVTKSACVVPFAKLT